jgi:hypothetical protein
MPQKCPGSLVSIRRVRPQRGLVALLVGLALSVGSVIGAPAATTWTVCAGGCDYATIKSAIAASTTLDGDTLAIAAGTYTEAGIIVSKNLTLQGVAAASTLVQAAAPAGAASTRVFTIARGVTATIRELTIRYGRAWTSEGNGGGLANNGALTLINCTIHDNSAFNGGGLFNNTDGTLSLINSTVRGNYSQFGGGLYNRGRLMLIDSTVRDNYAGMQGGGLYNYYAATATLINSAVRGNVADLGGGGLYNEGTLTLTNSMVSGNTSTSGDPISFSGGGLYNGGTLTLMNSIVSGNVAPGEGSNGGGLYNAGTLTLTNSTVSGNAAGNYGGGIYNEDLIQSSLKLIHSTVSGNAAAWGGGLTSRALLDAGVVTLTNSIVAKNPSGGDCVNDGSSITSHGYNLDSDGSCHLTLSSDLPGTDPSLGPLQDPGGPTLSHALLPGSPAIDAVPWGDNGCGTTLLSDQRWQARPQPVGGHCDIGAYEVEVAGQALSPWVSGFTPHTAVCENVTTGQAVTLTNPASPWDCAAAGLAVSSGDEVALRVRGSVQENATDVGGAVVGMTPSSGGCTNRTTGQAVKFQALFQGQRGATAASCVAAGLVIRPNDQVQLQTRGVAVE